MGNKFNVIHLAKNEAIIKGKKKGQVHYADTTQYNELKTNQAVAAAGQEMDDAIARRDDQALTLRALAAHQDPSLRPLYP